MSARQEKQKQSTLKNRSEHVLNVCRTLFTGQENNRRSEFTE